MTSCYDGASEAVSARIDSEWNRFRELSGVLVENQDLSLKQQEKIYQCCGRPILLCCCETWELTIADEARLHRMKHQMIRIMCEVRLADDRNGKGKLKQNLPTLVNQDNGIKTDVVVVVVVSILNISNLLLTCNETKLNLKKLHLLIVRMCNHKM